MALKDISEQAAEAILTQILKAAPSYSAAGPLKDLAEAYSLVANAAPRPSARASMG